MIIMVIIIIIIVIIFIINTIICLNYNKERLQVQNRVQSSE